MLLFRAAPVMFLAGLIAAPLPAQSGGRISDLIPTLFRFGDCGQPLCLNSTANTQSGHGDHYIGGARSGSQTVLDFLSGAIAVGVSNIPVSTATSGITFSIVGGAPVPTSSSGGPIFGERVQTLGRNRFLAGVNVTGVEFAAVRGVPLDNLSFTFTHANTCRTDPNWQPGQACPFVPADTALGSPTFENDVIEVNTSINLKLQVASLYFTYGLLDRVDIGVSVPLVRADLSGGSIARIVPFDVPTPHFFGTSADPVLAAGTSVSGTATGIGDVAARLKINLGRSDRGLALLTEARFPTGDEKEFLGSGKFALRALAIASTRLGDFSPHLNVGYFYREGDGITDAVLTTVGFDQLLASWATLAVDVLGQWQVTKNPLTLPRTAVRFTVPSRREAIPTNIPNQPDNLVDGSLGFKFLTRSGITLVTNALVPLNDGGIRGRVVWTGGLEYNF